MEIDKEEGASGWIGTEGAGVVPEATVGHAGTVAKRTAHMKKSGPTGALWLQEVEDGGGAYLSAGEGEENALHSGPQAHRTACKNLVWVSTSIKGSNGQISIRSMVKRGRRAERGGGLRRIWSWRPRWQ